MKAYSFFISILCFYIASASGTPINSNPKDNPYLIKGIHGDNGYEPEIRNSKTGVVALNFLWSLIQPKLITSAYCPKGYEKYQDRCFPNKTEHDQRILNYNNQGIRVMLILGGTPTWAVPSYCAKFGNTGGCPPANPADFGIFAGWLAKRFNGKNGYGKVDSFVIYNEVNTARWYQTDCGIDAHGNFVDCDGKDWIRSYGYLYNAAYDEIVKNQSDAVVLTSFTPHFDERFNYTYCKGGNRKLCIDPPLAGDASISVKTMIKALAPIFGKRHWSIGYHPYSKLVGGTQFSPDDIDDGYITFGNLGSLAGWLRAEFPKTPSAWNIYLTESGFSSVAPFTGESIEEAQKQALCQSYRAALGTPGIKDYIYWETKDFPNKDQANIQVEEEAGIKLGLLRYAPDEAHFKQYLKPAGKFYFSVNNPGALKCGFEDLPYVRIKRGYDHSANHRGHWVTSRLFPEGFKEEVSWKVPRDSQPGTHLVYECRVGAIKQNHTFPSLAANCEGQLPMGPLGYFFDSQIPNTVPIYRCTYFGKDHLISEIPCNTIPGGWTQELPGPVGYAYRSNAAPMPTSADILASLPKPINPPMILPPEPEYKAPPALPFSPTFTPMSIYQLHYSNKMDEDYLYSRYDNEARASGYALERGGAFKTAPIPSGNLKTALMRCRIDYLHFLSTSANCEGQTKENIFLGYVSLEPISGTVPLYRIYHSIKGLHYYSTNAKELTKYFGVDLSHSYSKSNSKGLPWIFERIEGYVLPP